MTILFLYDSPLRPEIGGTERSTWLVMNELQCRGYRTIGLLHATRTNPDRFYLNGESINSLEDFLFENKVDVVVNQIAFHYWLLEDFLAHGGLAWKNRGGKIISFMHLDPTPAPKKRLTTYFEDWYRRSLWQKIKRILFIIYLPYLNYKIDQIYKYSLHYLYEHSDKYILMSKSFTQIFVKLSGVKDLSKLAYIPNMLTFPKIESDEIIKSKDKVVLIVARLDDEQKNISFIIDVWRLIGDHRGYTLHIVGAGRDKEKLESRAKGINDIIFEGQQSPFKWYLKAQIFLMASPREGWGLTITESLQCGVVPVILNTSSVFKDIVVNGKNGYLVHDKIEYIQCVERLMSNNVLRDEMAREALHSARRFSAKQVGNSWVDLLSNINQK